MGKFGWIVNKEYDFGESKTGNDVEITGPREMTATIDEIKTLGTHFKMFDDDDNLYYSGYVLSDGGHSEWLDTSEFMPLEHYGTPNAGCTYMKLRQDDGSYKML